MTRRMHSKGTANVLVDLGFEDAEELTVKATLAHKINELVAKRGVSQMEAADIVGMPQSKISQIRNYRLQNISLERLMHKLVAFGERVEIVVKPAQRRRGRAFAVTA